VPLFPLSLGWKNSMGPTTEGYKPQSFLPSYLPNNPRFQNQIYTTKYDRIKAGFFFFFFFFSFGTITKMIIV
jgi:hypothetical protein